MRLPLLALLAAGLTLPGCMMARDAVSAVKAIPRPHLIGLDPAPYPVDAEGLIEYCKAIDARYEYGRVLVGQGNALLVEGKDMVSEGSFRIRSGEAKVTAAETGLSNARRELGLKRGSAQPHTRDFDLLNDPKRYSRIQTQLDNGLRSMERGQDMIRIGERRVAEGRARIQQGIDKIREGQNAMQDDEGRCLNLKRSQSNIHKN